MPIITIVIKPSNCSNLCKCIVLINSAGKITPYMVIIQIEPIIEPIISIKRRNYKWFARIENVGIVQV